MADEKPKETEKDEKESERLREEQEFEERKKHQARVTAAMAVIFGR